MQHSNSLCLNVSFRSWMVAGAVLAGLVLLPASAVAAQADGGQQAVPEDDPFADELNPLGGKAKPADAKESRPSSPPARPLPKLPVPFPDTDEPGQAAEPPTRRRPSVQRDTAPAARGRDSWELTPAEELLAEAEKLDHAGKLEEARAKLREVIDLDPKMTIAYLALGVVSRRLGDLEGSVDACSKGLAIDPQDAELYLRRGIAWFHLGLHGIALEDFEDAAGIAYDDPRPELWRGLALVELDRPLEAINAYASAIRRDRTFMIAYLNRGLAYLRTEQPRKAEFDFDQAIRHDPSDARAWFNRGVAQAQQKRFAAAVNSYQEALKRNPKLEGARRNLEAARSRIGR